MRMRADVRTAPLAYRRPRREGAVGIARAGVTLLFLGTVAAGIASLGSGVSNSGLLFHFLIWGFAIYLWWECLSYLRRADAFGLLAPPFLASVMHFYLAYVLPSTATLGDPWILDQFGAYLTSQADQFNQTVFYLSLSAFCMWRGYAATRPLAAKLRRRLQSTTLLRRQIEPALLPVLGLQLLYFAMVAFAISRGVFGFASTLEARQNNLAILDFISLGLQAGSLSLFLLLTYVFQRSAAGRPVRGLAVIGGILICMHLVVGGISGFKSQMVMPFVMLTFAKFVATRRISLASLFGVVLALFVAYQLIEPYRAYLHRNALSGSSDAGSLIDALQKSQEQLDLMHEVNVPLLSQMASRFDLTGVTAVGIAFAANGGATAERAAAFAESLYLSPILAYAPRFLWPDKPSYASGLWFNNVVIGKTEDASTSVGMGPVTWLYIVGGTVGIAVGFFCIGFVQCLMFEGVARSGAGGLIMFLGTATTLVMLPTDVGPALTSTLRILPLAFAAQFILLRPVAPQRHLR